MNLPEEGSFSVFLLQRLMGNGEWNVVCFGLGYDLFTPRLNKEMCHSS